MLFISIIGIAQTTPVQQFHDTKGNIDVNGAGQLQFTLPIALPPGVKNVAPEVNLVYNSGSSNGVAGYGWNMSGITSISRVGKNIDKDGEMKGVQLDYSDFYNFNGQRLVLKSGEYGKDGAEYVTEKYSNTKIKSVGTLTGVSWQGPEYWEVTFADGSQAWYGATGSGNNTARTLMEYNIVKWKDAQGNYITYNYTQDAGTNVAIISSIKWGGNETLGKPHFNEIEFTYNATSTRTLIEQSFINGISLIQDKLLNHITVKNNNSQYRKFVINYRTDNTKYQFVEKIQEYNSQNQPANPIEFFQTENTTGNSPLVGTPWSGFNDLVLSGSFTGNKYSLDFINYESAAGSKPAGYYMSSGYYLGSANVFSGATPLTIKDGNNTVISRQGFVSYSVNSATKDLTLSFYLIDLNKPIALSSSNYPNALELVWTKVIPKAQWDESVTTLTSNPYNLYKKTTTIKKLISYDTDGDGVSEVLIEKKNSTIDKWCSGSFTALDSESQKIIPPDGSCETITFDDNKYIVVKQQDNSFPFFEFTFDKSENIYFGDFNGDGIDEIANSFVTSSTNIDGESVPGNILKGYNLKKNALGNLNLLEAFSANFSGVSSKVQLGDFNGDGISDVFAATNVNGHYIINLNTGKAFLKTPYFNHFNSTESYSNPQNGNHSVVKVLDINKDGKSDIVNFSSSYNIASSTSASTTTILKVSENHGYSNGSIQFVSTTPFQSTINVPAIHREVVGLSQNLFCFYSPPPSSIVSNGNLYKYIHYSDLQRSAPINKIVQGGVITTIGYESTQNYYKPIKTEQYPLMELANVNSQLVSRIFESGDQPNTSRFKEFRYRGLIINLHNKKTIGFRQIASSSWNSYIYPSYNLITPKIWSGSETNPLNEGAPVKEWSIRTNDESKIFPIDISENNTELLSVKSTVYQTDKLLNGQVVTTIPDAEKAKVVTAILPKTNKGKDFLTGTTAESTVTYGQYYLPSQTISKINNSYAVTTANYLYDNNPSGTGANYYIGRQTSNTEVVQAYGDNKSSKEELTYENNLIKTIKNWNRDNTAYTLDTFIYDGFGNITQKVSGNSIDSQTITSGYEYDPKGRFVVKQTDNLGLQTETIYNDWGQIVTKTDPFNNIITNTYDSWGKVSTSTSNLGGTTSYQYDKDNNSNVIVTQNDADNNISKKFTNKLGQNYKTSTKAFGQGQFVSQSTQFDALGRKVKESEPYFEGQNVNQWNIIAYDESVYPAIITATTFNGKQTTTTISGLTTTVKEINGYGRTTSKTADALGNIVSSTDAGGTINFAFNAAGEQIEAKYGTNVVTTKYDAWGRKSEFNDPSNGLYTYEYDGFGRAKKTISPKGEKEYTYNNFGQLINQVELSSDGVSTIKNITFTYDNLGRLTLKSGTSNGKPYSLSFEYDTFGRINSSIENSNGRRYAQHKYDYDSLSRIKSYVKSLVSSGVLTEVTIAHMYNSWNGELYQLKDLETGRILWELQNTNAKGQNLTSKLGEATINNTYDSNGFLTNINHSSAVKPGILQIGYSFNAIKNELNSRTTGGDFTINENFEYDGNNRLASWTNPKTGQNSNNVYEIDGRILENDQLGKVKYGNSSKIYQATSVELNPSGVQNYTNDIIQYVGYNENNDPVYVDGLNGDVAFQYGLTSMRQRVTYGGNFDFTKQEGRYTKLYSEDGSFEVTLDNETKSEKHILYIAGNPYESNILFVKNYKDSKGSYKFLHKDYLGSILAISDEKGQKTEQRHFDAWGNLTHLQIGNGSVYTDENAMKELIAAQGGLLIDRGYTSHEHFSDVKIIHMNGRLYDPLLRRFLNADEHIQDPSNTQNYNKYGYVMNNPMMYNDPDGEFWAWAIGTLVGSYLNGVQANNGNWNPVKWDWKNTWLSVVGGGIAGAAIGGGIQNISTSGTKFIQNSVVGAVGSIFNGLGNGQNIFKSALIGFSGINYTFNIGNNVTSTGIDAGYKYIVSPEADYSAAGWEDLTKSILLNYVKNNFCVSCSYGSLQQMAGTKFENAFNSIMGLDLASFNYTGNDLKISGMYRGKPRNTIPDGIYDLVRDEVEYRKDNFKVGPYNIRIPIPTGFNTKRFSGVQFAEVKAMDGTLYSSSNQGQLEAMITSMHTNRGVNSYGGQFLIGTTSDTFISPKIYTLGASFGKSSISILHMTSQYRMISGAMQIRFIQGWMNNPTSTTYLK